MKPPKYLTVNICFASYGEKNLGILTANICSVALLLLMSAITKWWSFGLGFSAFWETLSRIIHRNFYVFLYRSHEMKREQRGWHYLFWGKDSNERKFKNWNFLLREFPKRYIIFEFNFTLEENKNMFGNIFILSKGQWAIRLWCEILGIQ